MIRSHFQDYYHLNINLLPCRLLIQSGRNQYYLLSIVWWHHLWCTKWVKVSFVHVKLQSITLLLEFPSIFIGVYSAAVLLFGFLEVAVAILGRVHAVATLDVWWMNHCHLSCTLPIQKSPVCYLVSTYMCTRKHRCCLILCSLQGRGADTIDFVSAVCRGLWLTKAVTYLLLCLMRWFP